MINRGMCLLTLDFSFPQIAITAKISVTARHHKMLQVKTLMVKCK